METIDVSQAPAISEMPAVAAPPAGGATMATIPSAVQDLARLFLSLSGSSSLGAVGGVAGVAAPASGVGVQLCPAAPGGGAVAPCAATAVPAGVSGPPSASGAVPGSSGHQQRQETSRSSRHRRRSSTMVPVERRRNVLGVGLLPLVLLLATGRGPIGRPRSLLRIPELRPLLPELDVRLEVPLVMLAPLRWVAALLALDSLWTFGSDGAVVRRSGAVSLRWRLLIPRSFGCGG